MINLDDIILGWHKFKGEVSCVRELFQISSTKIWNVNFFFFFVKFNSFFKLCSRKTKMKKIYTYIYTYKSLKYQKKKCWCILMEELENKII